MQPIGPSPRRRRKPGHPLFRRLEAVCQSHATGVLTRISAMMFLLTALLHALIIGGHFGAEGSPVKEFADNTAHYIGLSAEEISISGLRQARPEQVLAAIGIEKGSSLIGFDVSRARARLNQLDWVAHSSVLRLFPNRLHIEVTERAPYALWQTSGRFLVIDESGRAMTHLAPADWAHLPVVVGRGAQENAAELVNQLSVHSSLKLLVRAAARVADRHWNLYLANGIRVLLPEKNVPAALDTLVELERDQEIMGREITSIDLRLPDRVTLRLSEKAASARNGAKVETASSQ